MMIKRIHSRRLNLLATTLFTTIFIWALCRLWGLPTISFPLPAVREKSHTYLPGDILPQKPFVLDQNAGKVATARPGHHETPPTPPRPRPPALPQGKSPTPVPPGVHPIRHLIDTAGKEMNATLSRQSKTLEEAVVEYRRRHNGLAPPPHFDRWWAFARERDVQLMDEFDGVADLLLPFWGLSPATMRSRAAEALGQAGLNGLLGVQVRGGRVAHMAGGGDWQRKATSGMMASFVAHLPDMDLAFNVHDEPRVVVPHGDMARLVRRAKEENLPAAVAVGARGGTRNRFTSTTSSSSARSKGRRVAAAAAPALQGQEENGEEGVATENGEGRPDDQEEPTTAHGFAPVPTTRFNTYAHQSTWSHSRMSCPPDSPARALDDADQRDDASFSAYGLLPAAAGPLLLPLVRNATAQSDICSSPSLASSFGFFERPNAFSVVQDLFPIFSASKVSSYADILYPSPWYWYERVAYDEGADPPWADKKARMYWRGSTTGGFSRNGGWRRHHRQRLVARINGDAAAGWGEEGGEGEGWAKAKILVRSGGAAAGRGSGEDQQQQDWVVKEAPRSRFAALFDVHFSHVGQCDPADCAAQEAHFAVKGRTGPATAWKYKHLLDVDGNAFSGRFYAFLRSRSLVYKASLFREWHADWLRPWVHYVPLGLSGEDVVEAVRFFGAGAGAGDDEDEDVAKGEGDRLAEEMAMRGREWAGKVLRNEDLEVWFFRLLLEYARVIDDDRENIGFSL